MLKMPFIKLSTMAATALAVIVTVFSTTNVLAAPTASQSTGTTDSTAVSSHQTRELRTDMSIYNKDKSRATQLKSSSNRAEFQQYLNRFALALSKAEAVAKSGSSSTNSLSINKAPDREMASLLHLIRGLEDKIGQI